MDSVFHPSGLSHGCFAGQEGNETNEKNELGEDKKGMKKLILNIN